MFDKTSRYRKLPVVTAPDPRGRILASVDLRLLPDVASTFRHTVEAGDRLDQLAYKYYKDPLHWWRIADANPEFLSPLALVGSDAVVTVEFPLVVAAGADPPWADMLAALRNLPGVDRARPVESYALVVSKTNAVKETVTRSVRITYNRINVTIDALAGAIEDAGFGVGSPVEISQVGRQIAIPPKAIG